VQRVHGDAAAGQLARPQPGQHDLHPFRPGVGTGAVVGAVAVLQVVRVQLLRVHPARGDEQDAAVCARPCGAGLQRRDQQLREQARPEDVHGEGDLVALGGLGALGGEQPCVVHQQVQLRDAGGEVRGERPDGRQLTDVADLDVHLRVRPVLMDPHPGPRTLLRVAHQEVHARPRAARPSAVAVPGPNSPS
jgi:hypothetical protein